MKFEIQFTSSPKTKIVTTSYSGWRDLPSNCKSAPKAVIYAGDTLLLAETEDPLNHLSNGKHRSKCFMGQIRVRICRRNTSSY